MRVLFFGRLRDLAGVAEMPAPPQALTLRALIGALATHNADLGEALAGVSIHVAVDGIIVRGDIDLTAAREIAFMPPMSGG